MDSDIKANVKRILIICDKINEINRIRKMFNQNYIVKATSAANDGAFTAKNFNSDLVIYHIGSDFKHLFKLYKELRMDKETSKTPLIVLVDFNSLKFLTDTIEMHYTSIIGTTITSKNLFLLVESLV